MRERTSAIRRGGGGDEKMKWGESWYLGQILKTTHPPLTLSFHHPLHQVSLLILFLRGRGGMSGPSDGLNENSHAAAAEGLLFEERGLILK